MTGVRDFGARGDGEVDDTEAIQHALEEGGGSIVFPPGVYRITRPIEVELARDGRTSISGSGGTATLRMDGPGPAIRLLGTHEGTALPESVRPEIWERERMPTVADLEIVGNHDQAVGIAIEGTFQATLTGLLIRTCLYGVHLIRRNRNVLLASSHIFEGRGPEAIGIYFDAVDLHQSIIVGTHISYHQHAGIKVRGGQVRNLQVTGSDIEYNFGPNLADSADIWIDAREGMVREVTIASNTIQARPSPGGANVRIEGSGDAMSSAAGLWTIAGNILQSQAINLLLRSCRGVAVTGNSFASGFERSLVVDDCRHVVVSGNTFDHNPDFKGDRVDGILVRGSAGVSLANLILEDTRAGGPEAGAAIEVRDSSEVTINACQVLDSAHRGIELAGVRHAQVSGCTIVDRRARPTIREAIRLAGPGRGNLVQGNLIGGPLVVDESCAKVSGNLEIRETERPGR